MKSTPELIKGELYHLMTHLVFPTEKRYSKDFYDRKFFIHVARTLQNELSDHVINASENKSEYILRIDLPTEKKGLIA